jgi:plastocyanin
MATGPQRIGIALLAGLLAACGGGGTTSPTGTTDTGGNQNPAPLQAGVQIRTDAPGSSGPGFSFSPNSVTIARGGTVTWTNSTGIDHNVTFVAATGAPQTVANFTTGEQVRTFTTAGTFNYTCTLHSGMTGSVKVQ